MKDNIIVILCVFLFLFGLVAISYKIGRSYGYDAGYDAHDRRFRPALKTLEDRIERLRNPQSVKEPHMPFAD